MEESREQEISLLDLWKMFRKHLGKIVGLTIIGAALAVVFMMLFVDREYQSQAQLLVNQSNSGQETGMQYNEIQSNVYLVNTYRDIIGGEAVLEAVNENLGNVFTLGELRNAISVEQSPNSQAFYVRAALESPTDAQNVVNNVITEFENTLMEFYDDGDSSVNIVSPASYNPNPVSPSLIMYALTGGMLGFIIMVGIILIQELMDNRIKSVDDLNAIGLIRLGEVNGLTQKQVRANRFRIDSDDHTGSRRV